MKSYILAVAVGACLIVLGMAYCEKVRADSYDWEVPAYEKENLVLIAERDAAYRERDAARAVLSNSAAALAALNAQIGQASVALLQVNGQIAQVKAERDALQSAMRDSANWRTVLALTGRSFYQGVIGCTGSMRPAVYCSDLEFNLVLAGSDTLSVGEIVTFRRPESGCVFPNDLAGPFTMHRIIEVLPDGFRTKGDANGGRDICTVPRSAVLSKVVAVVPGMYPERKGDR